MFGRLTIVTLATLIVMSCAPFRDSPFSDTLLRDDRNLNSVNMQKLGDIEADGVIRIAVMADSHGNYNDLDKAIADVNRTAGVDFVVHLGDLSNSSYNYEYDQFLAQYAGLSAPRFMVIGNHDALGAGPSLFRKAFGPSNYQFESAHVRFVFWNSVGLENPEDFDLSWLVEAVSSSSKPVLVFTHVPLDDPERFHGATLDQLMAVREDPKVLAVLNGHNHVYQLRTSTTGTQLLTNPRVENGDWVLFEIKTDGFHIKDNKATGATWVGFKTSSSFSL
ncbi:MAG: metallophosphoesterase [Bdellovibrionales bacterium]|nr:metallophosphoesterase [Bdellovibrionales bacterium]